MQSCKDTLPLQFFFGPPKPNKKANGRIVSIGASVTLAYVPPYAKRVGAESIKSGTSPHRMKIKIVKNITHMLM
jgi:hypothetical protein